VTVKGDAALVDAAGAGLLTVNDPVPWFCRSAALRATCNVVALISIVGRAEAFHNTTEFDSNPVPVIVIVAGLPGGTYLGEIAVIIATGLFTSNVVGTEAPPPGAGFCTVIGVAELPVKSAAGTTAVISVPLTNVVTSGAFFQSTKEPARKLVPFTSSVVSAAPAVTLAGLTLMIVGAGLFTSNGTAPDVPPPGDGFTTVTCATVPFASLLAASVTLKLVAELYVVAIAAPFHSTAELETNPDPVIVTGVSVEPALAEEGEIVMMAGTGFKVGGGLIAPAGPPPQLAVNHVHDKTKLDRTQVARFIDDSSL
jgi:hypothetical protein